MHLLPADRADRNVIDGERICDAISGIGDPEHVRAWAERFSLLSDPTRLTLLLALHYSQPICVTDLATATALNDSTVSQVLRLLRARGLVSAERDGRVVRYRLTDVVLGEQLEQLRTSRPPGVSTHPSPVHTHAAERALRKGSPRARARARA